MKLGLVFAKERKTNRSAAKRKVNPEYFMELKIGFIVSTRRPPRSCTYSRD